MPKFFSILKNKKLIFFVFLIFTFLALTFPEITIAVNGGPVMNGLLPSTPISAPTPAPVTAAVKEPGKFLLNCILFFCMLVFAAYTFAIMAVLIAARYAVLAALYILSPLAFAFWIFPASRLKKYHSQWWDEFLKWCFVGVFASFFIYLATKVIDASTKSGKLDTFPLFVAFIFIIVGYKMIRKTGGIADIAAGAIKGVATGGAGLAMGAVVGAGGIAMNRLGRTATGQRVKEAVSDRVARIQETLGAPEGHAAQQRTARERAAATQVNALRTSSAQGDRNRYEQLVRTGQGAMGAAAVTTANEHGDLGRLYDLNTDNGLNQANNRVAHAQAFGHERGEFERRNYQLRGVNEGAIGAYATAHPNVDPANIPATLRREQLAENLPTMTAPEFGRINHEDLGGPGGYQFVRDNFTPRMIDRIGVTGNADLIGAVNAHAPQMITEAAAAGANGNQGEFNRLNERIIAIARLPGAHLPNNPPPQTNAYPPNNVNIPPPGPGPNPYIPLP